MIVQIGQVGNRLYILFFNWLLIHLLCLLVKVSRVFIFFVEYLMQRQSIFRHRSFLTTHEKAF